METKAEEQSKLATEEQEHLQKKTKKLMAKVQRAILVVSNIASLVSAGMMLYKNTKNQLETLQNDVKSLGGSMKRIVANPIDIAKPTSLGNIANSASNSIDSAFGILDSGMSAMDFALSQTDFLPNKLQQKISEKELMRKLQEAQKKLQEIQQAAQKWIQDKTEQITSKIAERQLELQSQINEQLTTVANSIQTFTGADPKLLQAIMERAISVGKAYVMGKDSASDQLDALMGFAKDAALNQAMNAATSKLFEGLEGIGATELANNLQQEVPAMKKITGEMLEKAGISNNLDKNLF